MHLAKSLYVYMYIYIIVHRNVAEPGLLLRDTGGTWGPGGLGRDMGACSSIMHTGNIPSSRKHPFRVYF